MNIDETIKALKIRMLSSIYSFEKYGTYLSLDKQTIEYINRIINSYEIEKDEKDSIIDSFINRDMWED